MSFQPRRRTLQGRLEVSAPIETVFPLFSPAGEKLWVPGWDAEILHPDPDAWEEGLVFRTRAESDAATPIIWILARLDRAAHGVAYDRVEPGLHVARITVRCTAREGGRVTEARTSYAYVGLSESGNAAIDAMSQSEYDARMARWADWLDEHLVRSRPR